MEQPPRRDNVSAQPGQLQVPARRPEVAELGQSSDFNPHCKYHAPAAATPHASASNILLEFSTI